MAVRMNAESSTINTRIFGRVGEDTGIRTVPWLASACSELEHGGGGHDRFLGDSDGPAIHDLGDALCGLTLTPLRWNRDALGAPRARTRKRTCTSARCSCSLRAS